ncbi:unnamed protein product [Cylicocyclus nassatus]|uniref:Anaphase-promoting complex subunit 5 n=1 Tax=Cylicocyclus nassatus TaxID=53992 RepID=A0AA36GRJ7_CYLNA|nr:unnamed protein product [Cylicocyclus nassatus]
MTSAYAEWNQRQDRIVIPFNTRVNLDSLFGNVHSNVVCERITPCKLAIYILIQSLDELHQDVQAFTPSEHCSILSALYGIIEHGDMSYLDLKRIVRWIDRTIRHGVYDDFVESINSYLSGDDIMVQIDVMLQTRPNVVNFVCGKSYIGIWLKKLFAEWSRQSTQRLFDLNAEFAKWIQDTDAQDESQMMCETETDVIALPQASKAVVPFEIESSGRARKWILNQMHLLQVCPSAALPDCEIKEWCQIIKKNHADVVEVNLLEMLYHIRAMNLSGALESLRLYFDYSMFRMSDVVIPTTTRACRMGTLDQRSLRFSCLLQARLCRLFGDKHAARLLLSECVQQAQNHDVACLRMAMVELAALEAMPASEADLKTNSEGKSMESLLTTEGLLRMINQASDSETRLDGEDHRDPAVNAIESEHLFDQMNALVHLMAAITATRRCKPPTIVEDGLERAVRCSSGADDGGRARLISDAARATASSVRLRHGLTKSALSLASSLVETNYADGSAPRHETEAHVIAGVNMVYACAMDGEWDRATSILNRLKTIFTPELNWQTARHVQLCDNIVSFDTCMLRGEWEKCAPLLENIEVLDEAEAVLRKSLLTAVRGELTSARNLLETSYSKYETPATMFTHLRLRLQLAMILSAECRWSAATEMLQGVCEEANSIEQRNVAAMAQRRIAVVQLMSGDYQAALKSLIECEASITRYCSILERALFSIALAQIYSAEKKSRESLINLNKARVQSQQAGAFLFEKYVLQELAMLYHEKGNMDERDECANEFAAMDDKYAGHFDWKLV